MFLKYLKRPTNDTVALSLSFTNILHFRQSVLDAATVFLASKIVKDSFFEQRPCTITVEDTLRKL